MAIEEPKQGHPHTHYQGDGHPRRVPYWKRAHHDWKFWVAVALMLGAMGGYLVTNDLSHPPNAPLQQRVP